ncbi:metallophosphoesterase family protein [Limnoglobus roseus]|uniref:Serine/threonine protein phosphatase n=1 Tax=Limnoglobus roseus TaxID=2598579 RepID=A0A5C1ACW7_9BACT|nr:metallophosphoesterase family protein [Limnoglobus roseus]QEL15997.1 serine/threonine protein phosphatase [Limnoglobus roseus]
MAYRTIAIGDIHGCLSALDALLDALQPDREDTLIFLGDYIDRGPYSRGVLDRILSLRDSCQLIPLLGNHEESLLDALRDSGNLRKWLALGGTDTLRSYGWAAGGPRRALTDWFPKRHLQFLSDCRPYHETLTHLFLHAGYVPELPMADQPALALRWRVTQADTTLPHYSGKVAIVGHTPQRSGAILDLGHLVCIDTNCVRGGWLTALDTVSGHVWQTNNSGMLRTDCRSF